MLVLTLVVYNAGGWYLYAMARRQAETELARHLSAIGRTAVLDWYKDMAVLRLADPDSGLPLPLDWEGHAGRIDGLRDRLVEIRDSNELEDAAVLDRNHVVLANAGATEEPRLPPSGLDSPLIEHAFTSNTVAISPYYQFRERDHMRSYTPIVNTEGRPAAVLRLWAGGQYFKDLHRIWIYLLIISGVGSFLLVCVALVVYGLLINAVRAEQAMADADRLQSLGTLAAGIAHEIRNPLGIIRAISEELEEDLRDDEERRSLASDITGEVRRLNSMVSQFLTFARPGAGETDTDAFSLAEVLDDVVQLVHRGGEKEHIVFQCELDRGLPRFQMEENSIRQVLLNILLNAREALGDEGRIEVRLDRWGQFARIEIRDDGPGMDRKEAKRVFDPFFTTKPSGTGLGLAITRNIVVRYGGRIRFDSEPGRGTTVTVLLPLARGRK
jgi:signal transduction histidine kinase